MPASCSLFNHFYLVNHFLGYFCFNAFIFFLLYSCFYFISISTFTLQWEHTKKLYVRANEIIYYIILYYTVTEKQKSPFKTLKLIKISARTHCHLVNFLDYLCWISIFIIIFHIIMLFPLVYYSENIQNIFKLNILIYIIFCTVAVLIYYNIIWKYYIRF